MTPSRSTAARPVLAVLVGGASRRMGGRPKGRLAAPEGGGTLLEAIVGAARGAGLSPVLVGDAAPYGDLLADVPRIPDEPPGIGPVGGLSAALAFAGDRDLITVACDMPGVTPEVLRRIIDHPSEAPVLAVRREGRWEPMLARWRPGAVGPAVAAAIDGGVRSFQRLIERLPAETLPVDAALERALVDWDTPEQVGRLP